MHFYLSRWMNFWQKKTSHWIDQLGSYIRIRLVNGVQKKLWMDWNLTCQLLEVSVQYHQLSIKQQLSGRCTSEEYLKSIAFLYTTGQTICNGVRSILYLNKGYIYSVFHSYSLALAFIFLTKNVNVLWYINDQKKAVPILMFSFFLIMKYVILLIWPKSTFFFKICLE